MIPGPKLNITSNKMNKGYQNKFAPDIWCLFGGIIFCILFVIMTVCFLSLTKRVGLTACRTNSCNSGKGWTIWIE